MTYKFTIDGRLPNLNDYLKAERVSFKGSNGRFTTKGNELKKEAQTYIIFKIRRELKGLHISKPITIHYDFFEPNQKRDMDNVWAFCSKVTQDSLVQAKVIDNDGWANIKGISANFYVDSKQPRIEVTIVEI